MTDKLSREMKEALGGLDLQTPLAEQMGEKPVGEPAAEAPVIEPKTEIPVVGETLPPVIGEGTVLPAAGEVKPNKPENNEQPDQRAIFLKEIFGEDGFKTVEEAKTANTATLQEVESLRRDKTDLESKLNEKPKTNFASDEMAKFNEFAKVTSMADYGLFKKINDTDVAQMDPMDAIVTKYILDNPSASGNEANVKKYFEKLHNVDPELVEPEDLAINQIGLTEQGNVAKKALLEVKEKLIVPTPEEAPKPKEFTPEEIKARKDGWNDIGTKVGTGLAKLKIPISNSKDALLDYEISEVEQKEITQQVVDYAEQNQLELNEANVNMIANTMQNLLVIKKMPEIAHAIFEHARSMTEEQIHAQFENPSTKKNNDSPPPPKESTLSEREQIQADVAAETLKYMDGR